MKFTHQPVLLKEVLAFLIHNPKGTYVDCTLGEGGHSYGILTSEKFQGQLISLDDDDDIQARAKQNLSSFPNITIKKTNFRFLKQTLKDMDIESVDGIFADLGLSFYHYKESDKGFSFFKEDPLDMTLNHYKPNAFDVVNEFSLKEIEDILKIYGEEKHSYRIASFIDYYRKKVKTIETTKELATIIDKAIRSIGGGVKSSTHSATKSFQAIRIFVNQELSNLEILLKDSLSCLNQDGVMAVLTYHSLEDRIVKNFFKKNESMIKILTKKPIIPNSEEILQNNASRSAKLRIYQKR